jgi:NDP-sugar pyrophosphorylase family protein
VEKPPAGEAPSNLINAGTYILEPDVLDRIPDGRRVSIERETFPALAADGRVYGMASQAYWLDAGTPEAYLQAHADLLDGRRPGVPAVGASQVADGVWILGRPSLAGEVRRFSLIGDGAVIAEGARVESSVVGAGCVIEKGAVVEGSVLLPGVRVDAGAHVTGSILGRHAVVSEDCVVSALTVVGDGERLGRGVHLTEARVPV